MVEKNICPLFIHSRIKFIKCSEYYFIKSLIHWGCSGLSNILKPDYRILGMTTGYPFFSFVPLRLKQKSELMLVCDENNDEQKGNWVFELTQRRKSQKYISNTKAKEICLHVNRSVNHCLSVILRNTFVDSIIVHVFIFGVIVRNCCC